MNWEIAIYVAFCTMGIIQYLKAFIKTGTSTWVILQPILCLLLSMVWSLLPVWVSTGIFAFAISQLGYETIIQNIKKRLDNCVK